MNSVFQVEIAAEARKATATGVCIKNWGTTMGCGCRECSGAVIRMAEELLEELEALNLNNPPIH